MLASMESNPIEDDPGERTMGQQIEDESIETKAMVNIRPRTTALMMPTWLSSATTATCYWPGRSPTRN